MPSSSAIRLQIETKLANRVPAALSLKIKQAPELFATGIAKVDAILDGGVPRGSITEVAGAALVYPIFCTGWIVSVAH
jgi:RecA/RadA recombinase